MRAAAAVVTGLALAASCKSLPPVSPLRPDSGPKPVRAVELLVGQRKYAATTEWPEIDDPLALGLQFTWRRPDEALGWELALLDARDDTDYATNSDLSGRVTELSGGLRYDFDPLAKVFHPYLGGGVSVLNAYLQDEPFGMPKTEVEDWDVGLYAHGGIRADLTDKVYLGLDLRYLSEDWISAGDFDLDYLQLGLTIGSFF